LGIYVLVLEKPGYDPLLYIGSGTASYCGVIVRIADHHANRLSPVSISKKPSTSVRTLHTSPSTLIAASLLRHIVRRFAL
jgi:hypothetical protein